jgi:TRAP-type C4-dicarboxylate transport system permease small subunit
VPSRPAAVLAQAAHVIPALLLLGILALTCADVVLRYVFNAPIRGALELTEFAMAGVIFAAMPLVTARRENVVIDVLDGRLGASTTARMDRIAVLVAGVCSAFLAWRLALLAISLQQAGETTSALSLPVYPAAWFMAALAGANAVVCVGLAIGPAARAEGTDA